MRRLVGTQYAFLGSAGRTTDFGGGLRRQQELDQAGEFGPHPQTQTHPEQIALDHK